MFERRDITPTAPLGTSTQQDIWYWMLFSVASEWFKDKTGYCTLLKGVGKHTQQNHSNDAASPGLEKMY